MFLQKADWNITEQVNEYNYVGYKIYLNKKGYEVN
jgi:hypothetical protein